MSENEPILEAPIQTPDATPERESDVAYAVTQIAEFCRSAIAITALLARGTFQEIKDLLGK